MKREHKFFGCGCLTGGLAGLLAGFGLACLAVVIYEEEMEARKARAALFESAEVVVEGDAEIGAVLATLRTEHQMPAMAAAIVHSEGAVRMATAGVRKLGEDVPVTLDDLWHLGSNTKAMTGALAGLLIEAGELRWDSTAGEVFPELPRRSAPGLVDVTLAQLLSHYGGLPGNLNRSDVSKEGTPVEQRLHALRTANEQGLDGKPGEKHVYSNLGYTVAGAMIEKATGESWEDQITTRLFAPLGMESCGFGGTGTPGEIDQPWPHLESGAPAPSNGPDVDNPPIFSPGGRVHCTMEDWAKFVRDQLRGAQGLPGLLQPETYAATQSPPEGGSYAFGWSVAERGWGGGTVFNHQGSNTMNYANVWVAPKRDFAILVCANQGGDTAFKATDAAVGALIKLVQQPAGE